MDDYGYSGVELPDIQAMKYGGGSSFLTPEMADQLGQAFGGDEEKERLALQLAQARALMSSDPGRHITGAGAALGGLGADIKQVMGAYQQRKAMDQLQSLGASHAEALRALYHNPQVLRAMGLGGEPEETEQAQNIGGTAQFGGY